MLRQLSEEELKQTLARAREIAAESGDLEADGELETYVGAAAELGIPSEAMRQAIRERAPLIRAPLAVGDLVFAPSADGHWYPATLESLEDQQARVRFLSGADHLCAARELQPLSLIPGRRLQGEIKGWGWYGVRVERYEAGKGHVHVVHDDWTDTKEKLPLTKLRLQRHHVYPETAPPPRGVGWSYAWVAGLSLLAGYVLHHFVPHLIPFLR